MASLKRDMKRPKGYTDRVEARHRRWRQTSSSQIGEQSVLDPPPTEKPFSQTPIVFVRLVLAVFERAAGARVARYFSPVETDVSRPSRCPARDGAGRTLNVVERRTESAAWPLATPEPSMGGSIVDSQGFAIRDARSH